MIEPIDTTAPLPSSGAVGEREQQDEKRVAVTVGATPMPRWDATPKQISAMGDAVSLELRRLGEIVERLEMMSLAEPGQVDRSMRYLMDRYALDAPDGLVRVGPDDDGDMPYWCTRCVGTRYERGTGLVSPTRCRRDHPEALHEVYIKAVPR